MKLTTLPGEKLTPDFFDMPGVVLQCTAEGVYTLRLKPVYPKGFAALAKALWTREPLELRKNWKRLISGGIRKHEPIWEDTIDIYRGVLYLRLLNNERLHAGAPRRLPALEFHPCHGVPTCNYHTLPAPMKRELRNRIALRRSELGSKSKSQRQLQTPAVRPIPIHLKTAHNFARLQLWQFLTLTPPPRPQRQYSTQGTITNSSGTPLGALQHKSLTSKPNTISRPP